MSNPEDINSIWSLVAYSIATINANYPWFLPIVIIIMIAKEFAEYKLGKTETGSIVGLIIKLFTRSKL